MKTNSLVYVQMPHEQNFYHAGIDVLERAAKDKSATLTLTINKNGKWTIKNGMVKGSSSNFVNAVHEFLVVAYPNFNLDD